MKVKGEQVEHFFSSERLPPEHPKDRVSHISRSDALKQKPPTKEMKRVMLTFTYKSNSKPIKDIVDKMFHMLNLDDELRSLFHEKPLISY